VERRPNPGMRGTQKRIWREMGAEIGPEISEIAQSEEGAAD